jgi:hypothetical protein
MGVFPLVEELVDIAVDIVLMERSSKLTSDP